MLESLLLLFESSYVLLVAHSIAFVAALLTMLANTRIALDLRKTGSSDELTRPNFGKAQSGLKNSGA